MIGRKISPVTNTKNVLFSLPAARQLKLLPFQVCWSIRNSRAVRLERLPFTLPSENTTLSPSFTMFSLLEKPTM